MRLKSRTLVLLGLLSVAAGYGTPVHRSAKGGLMGTNVAAAQECLPRGADCTDTPVDC